jgi:putative ATPase
LNRVYVLESLTDDEMKTVLLNAAARVANSSNNTQLGSTDEGLSSHPPPSSIADAPCPAFPQLTNKLLSSIISLATGDARTAISLLELVLKSPLDSEEAALLDALKKSVSVSYDRTGESHYDMISALHKSVRGGQGSAAMYWLARMLTAGEDPLYIARRMVVCASEDIGLADPHALPLVSSLTLITAKFLVLNLWIRQWLPCKLVSSSGCRNAGLTSPT